MSKRNKRRFWQSQRAHIRVMLEQGCVLGQDTFDYHMEVYRRQRKLRKILSESEKTWVYVMEVLPF